MSPGDGGDAQDTQLADAVAAEDLPPDRPRAHRVAFPRPAAGPLMQVTRRLLLALLVLALTVVIVYADRGGYHDNADDSVSFLDSLYYSTVTLSTTGYGDIVPYSTGARLSNTFLVTPLRVIFLIILVGTTLEVLTERTREQFRLTRWRRTLRDHVVIVGYGTKGRSAARTLLGRGVPPERIVVVDPNPKVVNGATDEGYVAVVGDATRSDVLRRAEAQRARQIVVAAQRDDTAVLVTLTARQLNPGAHIVASVREEENAPLLRQSGADAVITSSGAAGRLLGLSVLSPSVGQVMDDLITYGSGLDLIERPVGAAETGKAPREVRDLVVSVMRDARMLDHDDPEAAPLRAGDRLITIRRSSDGPAAAPQG
ncbi:potassium channel family protein [Actinacidiphila bryophytorum]|uniref:potassium channel family protein n=1 Tax=Actinacidiphila bryophytorum TaxID=1436133 RepID=UPI002176C1D4|nr:potassium channel family protein [Actinacidiphila bryophytorum]UWE07337.1 potassium channel family protein [Actinacidiphila bryophytorum]